MDIQEILIDPALEAVSPLLEMAPRLLLFVATLLVGLLLAYLVKKLVILIAGLLSFNVLAYRIGLSSIVSKAWYDQTPVMLLGRVFYWLVLFLHLILAVSFLHVETLNRLLASTVAAIPLFAVAFVIFVVGYFVSRFLGRATLIALVNSQYRSARLIAFLVRGIILIFFIAIATDYIGVGRGIVEATFAIMLGGFVLALAIAFGLGGKDIARETLERKLRSLEKGKRESDEISHL